MRPEEQKQRSDPCSPMQLTAVKSPSRCSLSRFLAEKGRAGSLSALLTGTIAACPVAVASETPSFSCFFSCFWDIGCVHGRVPHEEDSAALCTSPLPEVGVCLPEIPVSHCHTSLTEVMSVLRPHCILIVKLCFTRAACFCSGSVLVFFYSISYLWILSKQANVSRQVGF